MNKVLSESNRRLYDKLTRDLGSVIVDALLNPDITEVMLNPDGGLWLESHEKGMYKVGSMSHVQATAIVNTVAGIHNVIVSRDSPHLEAELPVYGAMKGQRLTAQVPPVVVSPSFTIRKRAEKIYNLDEYVNAGLLEPAQISLIRELILSRANMLVCGSPSSGKTTFTNAILAEISNLTPEHRIALLEDLPELQCHAPNVLAMLTSQSSPMVRLIRTCVRSRIDRIFIGEVRGGEVLDMLKAWNTGCPGGVCTTHANGIEEAIQRVVDLSMEAGLVNPPHSLVNHTIDAVIWVVRKDNQKGFVQDIQLKGEKWI